MSISEKDIKKLWGLSAGRCNYPGCDELCVRFLGGDAVIIGEMAHVIAQSPGGPRGISTGGEDRYENLVLLCPTHHTHIDKAPAGTFPPDVLLEWKKQHELEVNSGFSGKVFSSRQDMAAHIKKLLIENHAIWSTYGPESASAQANPLSNLYLMWDLRKLDSLVPNNRMIIDIISQNFSLFDTNGYMAAREFVEHAEVFERSCYERVEGAPRFPKQFGDVIDAYCAIQ
jgi:hypothetical protein